MQAHLFKYFCLTNLHVGSGESNYNIVDNEVEKDISGNPVIFSSGVKGALREHFSRSLSEERIVDIFGKKPIVTAAVTAGKYKFLDACMLARPMRVSGSAVSSFIPVTTLDAVNNYLLLITSLNCNPHGISRIEADASVFGNACFLTNSTERIRIEGDITEPMPDVLAAQLAKLSDILGDTFALVRSFDEYPLPVIARNQLEKQISKNLWYEEIVPHHSVFYQITVTPGKELELPMDAALIQFGGNASIGCGFIKIDKLF